MRDWFNSLSLLQRKLRRQQYEKQLARLRARRLFLESLEDRRMMTTTVSLELEDDEALESSLNNRAMLTIMRETDDDSEPLTVGLSFESYTVTGADFVLEDESGEAFENQNAVTFAAAQTHVEIYVRAVGDMDDEGDETLDISLVADSNDPPAFELGTEASQTVTLLDNGPPAALNDSFDIGQNGSIDMWTSNVLSNDGDPDEDPLAVMLENGTSYGSLTIYPDGYFMYVPYSGSWYGTDSFTYSVSDGLQSSNVATVSIHVHGTPVAQPDSYTTDEDTPLNTSAAGVLGNDSDPDNETIVTALVSGAAHGSVTLNSDGSFGYSPDANYNGSDSFTYRVSDSWTSSQAVWVSLTINAINDPPVASDDGFTLNEDGNRSLYVSELLQNDVDVEAATLNLEVVSGVQHGQLDFTGSTFTYTPAANYYGTDTFTYRLWDGQAYSNAATVTLTVSPVNDPPTAIVDSYSGAEDATLVVVAVAGVLANDFDLEGDALSAVLASNPSHGTLMLNSDGSFTYVPEANYFGADSFTYYAHDGQLNSAPTTVTLSMTSVNDVPISVDDSYVMVQGQALAIEAAGVLSNDSDLEADNLTAVVASPPSNGSLTLNSNGGFTYTPNGAFFGTDSFTYSACDGHDSSSPAVVTIRVHALPVPQVDSYQTNEDTTLAIGPAGVLRNDSDPEGSQFTASLSSEPTHGSLSFQSTGAFTYVPIVNYFGSDSFTYRLDNGWGTSSPVTVSLQVAAVNDPPHANSGTAGVAEDATVSITLTGSDIENDNLSFAIVTPPAHGSFSGSPPNLSYTPSANFYGQDTFTFRASDGAAYSHIAAVVITVTPVNDAPTANPQTVSATEDTPKSFTLTGNDIENSPLSFSIVVPPSHGTLSGAGPTWTYTPEPNFFGSDGFLFSASDGTANSSLAMVTMNVAPVGDPPTATPQQASLSEDGSASVTLTGSDPDQDSLTYFVTTNPTHGTLSGAAPNLSYTPTANYNGTDSFQFKVFDGTTLSSAATVTLRITPTNDPPTAVGQSISLAEDTSRSFQLIGMDPDFDTLSYDLVSPPTHGTLTGSGLGLTYTPSANFSGSDSLTFRVSDGQTISSTATVTIQVTPVNDSPTANADLLYAQQDTPKVYGLSGSDPEGDSLTFSIVSPPAHGTLGDSQGVPVYIPALGFVGTDGFLFRASDGAATSNAALVTIEVAPYGAVHSGPDIPNVHVLEDSDVTIIDLRPFFRSDVDEPIVYSLIAAGDPNLVESQILEWALRLKYEPDAHGETSIQVRATGAVSGSYANASFNVTIDPVNDNPIVTEAFEPIYIDEDGQATIDLAAHFFDRDVDLGESQELRFNVTVIDSSAPWNPLSANDLDGSSIGIADGTITLTTAPDLFGYAELAIQATDGKGGIVATTLWVVVTPVNDVPVSQPIPDQTYSFGWEFNGAGYVKVHQVVIDLWAYFIDIEDYYFLNFDVESEGDAIPEDPTVDDNGFLTFIYDGTPGFEGTTEVTVTASDREGASVSRTFTVTVDNPEDGAPPTRTPLTETALVPQGEDFLEVPLPDPQFKTDLELSWPEIPEELESDPGAYLALNDDYSEGGLTTKTVTVGPGLVVTVLARARDNEPDRGLRQRTSWGFGTTRFAGSDLKYLRTFLTGPEVPDDWEYKDTALWNLDHGYNPSPGTFTFTAPEGVQLWIPAQFLFPRTQNPGFVPARLVPLPTDEPIDLWGGNVPPYLVVEGLEVAQGDITVTFEPLRDASESSRLGDSVAIKVMTIDVAIDSNNDSSLDIPEPNGDDDDIEHDPGNTGKLVLVNASDDDFDGIPDFLDGFNLDGYYGTEDHEADDEMSAAEAGFTPLVIALPAGLDPEKAELAFSYAASDPNAISVQSGGWRSPASGGIRLWTKDEGEARDPYPANDPLSPGDYIAPSGYGAYFGDGWGYYGAFEVDGQWSDPAGWNFLSGPNSGIGGEESYKLSSLGYDSNSNTITLYIEGVSAGHYSIYVGLDPDGNPDPETDENGNYIYDQDGHQVFSYEDLFLGYTITDAVDLTVYSEVSVSTTDKYAQEASAGQMPDDAAFTISRGAGNVFGSQTVYYKLIYEPGPGAAIDPRISAANADYGISSYWGLELFDESAISDTFTRVGMVTIPNGQSSVNINIFPLDDGRVEWDENVRIELITAEEYRQYHDFPGSGVPGLDPLPITPGDGVPESGLYGWDWINLAGEYSPSYYGWGSAYHYGTSNLYEIVEIGPNGYGRQAEVIILDNDAIETQTNRNKDPGTTGQDELTQANNRVEVSLHDGSLALVLPLGDNLPTYHSGDNLQPLGVVEMQLPWNEGSVPSQLKAQLTFATQQGSLITFNVSGLSQYLQANPARTLRLAVLGPGNLAELLPTGNYDFRLTVVATTTEGVVQRTARGQTEIVNRVGDAGETEFGRGWWLDDLDRLVPGDGVNFPGPISFVGSSQPKFAASEWAAQGAAVDNGMALIRGDASSAWYASTAGTPKVLPVDPDASLGESVGEVEIDREVWLPLDYNTYGYLDNILHDRAESRYTSVGLGGVATTAEWKFEDLPAGRQFQVYVTWDPAANRASNAPYTVTGARAVGSGQASKSILVEQRYTPGEYSYGGKTWRSLGFYVVDGSPGNAGELSVTLSTELPEEFATEENDFVDGLVVAGSVMIVDCWTFATPAGSFNQLVVGALDEFNLNGYWVESGYSPPEGFFTLVDKWGTRSEFDAHGLLEQRVDRNGNRVQYIYADRNSDSFPGELVTLKTQGNLVTTYDYAGGFLTGVTDLLTGQLGYTGRTTVFSSPGGFVTDIYQPNPDDENSAGPETHFTYSSGLLTSVRDAGQHTTTINYTTGTRMVRHVVNPDTYAWLVQPLLGDGLGTSSANGSLRRPVAGDVARSITAAGYGGVPEPRASYADPKSVVAAATIGQLAAYFWYYQTDIFGLATAMLQPTIADPWRWNRTKDGLPTKALLPPGGGGYREEEEPALSRILITYNYDVFGNQTRLDYENGHYETWFYGNPFGVVTNYELNGGHPFHYDLDDRGNVEEMTEAGLRSTIYSYTPHAESVSDLPGGLVTFVTVAAGTVDQVISNTQYYPTGDPRVGLVSLTNPGAGVSTTYDYDDNRNLASTTFSDRVTNYEYDRLNRLRKQIDPDPQTGQHGRPTTKYVYDAVGNLRHTYTPRGYAASPQYYAETTYDAMNRILSVILPAPGGSDFSEQIEAVSSRTYDPNGNLHFEYDAYGHATEHRYDIYNREILTILPAPNVSAPNVTLPGDVTAAPVIARGYDVFGNLAWQTDPRSTASSTGQAIPITRYRYDVLNRVIQIDGPPTEDHALGTQTVNQYNARGLLASRQVRSYSPQGEPIYLVTEYSYDDFDRLAAVVFPPNAQGAVGIESYDYDLRDNRTKVTDAYGNYESTSYDALDRPLFVFSRDPGNGLGRLVTQTGYKPTGEVEYVRTFNALATTLYQQTTYQYDDLGRLVVETGQDPDGNGPREAAQSRYVYDLDGNRLSDTLLPSPGSGEGLLTEYKFDNLGRNWKVLAPQVTLTDQQTGATAYVGQTIEVSYDLLGHATRQAVTNRTVAGTLPDSVTNYDYDDLGRLYKVTSPEDASEERAASYTFYDAAGNARILIDGRGAITRQEYDALGRLKRVIQPDTPQHPNQFPTVTYAYDPLGNRVAETDTLNRTTRYEYDAVGRVVRMLLPAVDGGVPTVEYVYDLNGNLERTIDPEGNIARQEFDGLDRVRKTIHPAANGQPGEVETEQQWDSLGRIEWTKDEQQRTTQYHYDLTNRTTEILPPGAEGTVETWVQNLSTAQHVGDTWSWTFGDLDPRKHYVVYAAWLGDPANASDAIYRFCDGDNAEDRQIGGEILRSHQEASSGLDFDGMSFARLFSAAAFSGTLTVQLDASAADGPVAPLGIYVEEVVPGSANVYRQYGDFGRLDTQKISPSDEDDGETTGYEYDELGRTVNATDAEGNVTRLGYDLAGNQVGIKDPAGNVTAFAYDPRGQLTSETIWLGGSAVSRTYQYDASGNRTRAVDRNGRVRQFEYDALNRPVGEVWYNSVTAANNHTGAVGSFTFAYDVASRLQGAGDSNTTYDYDYDALDRLTSEERTGLGGTIGLLHPYPDRRDGQREYLDVYLGGGSILDTMTRYTYDGNGRLTGMSQTGGNGAPAGDKYVELAYLDNGQFDQITRYEAQGPLPEHVAVRSQYTYDSRELLVGLRHFQPTSTPLAEYTWTHDADGRILRATSYDGTAEYAYYDDGQLKSAAYNYADTVSIQDESYTYDDNGNRTGDGRNTGAYNRPQSDGTSYYEYDLEGNRTAKTDIITGARTEYTWDHRNRLTSVLQKAGLYANATDAGQGTAWDVLPQSASGSGVVPASGVNSASSASSTVQMVVPVGGSTHTYSGSTSDWDATLTVPPEGGEGTLTVRSMGNLMGGLSVSVNSSAPDDLPVSGLFGFEFGVETTYTTTFQIPDDDVVEGPENVTVTLAGTFGQIVFNVTIDDNEAWQTFGFGAAATHVAEGTPITLSAAFFETPPTGLVLEYWIEDLSTASDDYLSASGTFWLAPDQIGNYDTVASIQTILDDLAEGVESVRVHVRPTLFPESEITLDVTIDDTPVPVSITATADPVSEGSVMDVGLTTDHTVTLEYWAEDLSAIHGTDYTGQMDPSTVTIFPGTIQYISFQTLADSLSETTEAFKIHVRVAGQPDSELLLEGRIYNVDPSEGTVVASVSYAYDYLNRLIQRTADEDGVGSAPEATNYFVHDGNQIILRLNADGSVKNRYLWGPNVNQLLTDEAVLPLPPGEGGGEGDLTSVTRWALGDQQNTPHDLAILNLSGEASVLEHRTFTAFGKPLSPSAADEIFGSQGEFYDSVMESYLQGIRWRKDEQWFSEDPSPVQPDTNRRRVTHNDPINFIDPTGLEETSEQRILREGKAAIDQNGFNLLNPSSPGFISYQIHSAIKQSAADARAKAWEHYEQSTNPVDKTLDVVLGVGLPYLGEAFAQASFFAAEAGHVYAYGSLLAKAPAIGSEVQMLGRALSAKPVVDGLTVVGTYSASKNLTDQAREGNLSTSDFVYLGVAASPWLIKGDLLPPLQSTETVGSHQLPPTIRKEQLGLVIRAMKADGRLLDLNNNRQLVFNGVADEYLDTRYMFVREEVQITPFVDDAGNLATYSFRADRFGVDRILLQPEPIEYKSSMSALLRDNQRLGFPLFSRHGGQINGDAAGLAFPDGTILPPRSVLEVRPQDLPRDLRVEFGRRWKETLEKMQDTFPSTRN